MELNRLPKIVKRSAKRVGRGIGSGKGGHQSGRGQKGQKSRGKIPQAFEGTKFKKSLIKRVPMQRGKGKFKSWDSNIEILNLSDFADWPEKDEVTLEQLKKKGLIKVNTDRVKILSTGILEKKLIVKVPVSKGTEKKVAKAGGKIVV